MAAKPGERRGVKKKKKGGNGLREMVKGTEE